MYSVVFKCEFQVNRSPSFGTNEQLDYDIKSAVIEDALRLVHIRCVSSILYVMETYRQVLVRILCL